MKFLRVALNVPLPTLFDYACDEDRAPGIGARVRVPFGRREMVGYVLEHASEAAVESHRIKKISAVLTDFPPLPRELIKLAGFLSTYYQHPLGEALFNALPLPLRSARPFRMQRSQVYALSESAADALNKVNKRAKQQRALIGLLEQRMSVSHTELAAIAPGLPAAARTLLKAGLVRLVEASVQRGNRFVDFHAPTAEQARAIADIEAQGKKFGVFVLHGITGSGKTEVYVRLIAERLSNGGQTLVLVPEISLTPQLEQWFRGRFPDAHIVSLHSSLSDGERTAHWLAAQSGAAQIVLGTRLAVLTPLPGLALIVVDEEHDTSFKQQDGMRYSARDVAIYRAKARGVPVVLGSATPSLETYAHALSGRYHLLRLVDRAVEDAVLPPIRSIDTRGKKLEQGLSPELTDAIDERLRRGEQSLIFLNRRGYAPVLACTACGWVSGCPRCSSHLVLHLADRVLRCHHCGHQSEIPRACPTCGNQDIHPFGRGTQRIEETVRERFPSARVVRVDRDSTRTKRAWEKLLAAIHAGEADILVGTQMLAKGHDFPKLTLVGILNSDSALFAADYRAPERLFSTLLQVSGRAGRADLPGEVLIQTEHPGHPLYRALAHHDFEEFARIQLAEREAAGFPPYMYQAMLRAEAERLSEALDFLKTARALPPAQAASSHRVQIYDPVPMTLTRRASRERAQLLVESRSRPALQDFLHEWTALIYDLRRGQVRWSLDVDPIEF
jgi:primosomal protein N' (replication factor Y) (superfamily II helicase)